MSTNWLIRFVDGSDTTQRAETIQQAMNDAEFRCGKPVRSASFIDKLNWSFDDIWDLSKS